MTRGRRKKREKKTINPSMNAYGNLTLGMAIKMQFKSICLLDCNTNQRRSMQMNTNGQVKCAVSGRKKTDT